MLGRKVMYVRCISFSYNNVAKGIRLLHKKAILVYTRTFFMQVTAFKNIYTLNQVDVYIFKLKNHQKFPTDLTLNQSNTGELPRAILRLFLYSVLLQNMTDLLLKCAFILAADNCNF